MLIGFDGGGGSGEGDTIKKREGKKKEGRVGGFIKVKKHGSKIGQIIILPPPPPPLY